MIIIMLSPILNQFYCHLYLVTESPSISGTHFPTSFSSSLYGSIVTPTPTVTSGK